MWRCVNCHATARHWTGFCRNCLGKGTFVADVHVPVAPQSGALFVTAREFGRGRSPALADVFSLGAAPDVQMVVGLHGPPGGGKTTALLKLAQSLNLRGRGPVLFTSLEEGLGETLREKLARLELYDSELFLTAENDWNYLLGLLSQTAARWLMVDSAAQLHLGQIQFEMLKRGEVSLAFALHEAKDGGYMGSADYGHTCDVLLRVEAGRFTQEKNRFGVLCNGEVFVFDEMPALS